MKIALSWSSGKDSALAFARLAARDDVTVATLITTVNERRRRVAIHGVRESVLDAQARALGSPLRKVPLPEPCSNAVYEARFGRALAALRAEGIEAVAFGDIFLADVRAYRERLLAAAGLAGLFPLWGEDTGKLAEEMIKSGVRARIAAVQRPRLAEAFLGRDFDEAFLAEIPADVDPCGENGEFHSCVWDMPGFAAPIRLRAGERVIAGEAAYVDLVATDALTEAAGAG